MSVLDLDQLGAFCRHTHVELDGAAGGPLSGLTFGLKDIYDVAGHKTGFGSPDWLASHDAPASHSFVAQRLLDSLRHHRPPVVHVVRFPQLSINHALLVFDATETAAEIRFAVYDPNNPLQPATLIFQRTERTFRFPASHYFAGGRVDVYEVYRNWLY